MEMTQEYLEFRKSASAHPEESLKWGIKLLEDGETLQEAEDAFKLLTIAYKKKLKDSYIPYGICYLKGIGTSVSYWYAAEIFQKAIDSGDKKGYGYKCQALIYEDFYNGAFPTKEEVLKLMNEAIAIQDPRGYYCQGFLALGYFHETFNFPKARECAEIIEQAMPSESALLLAMVYHYDEPSDVAKAIRYYNKAIILDTRNYQAYWRLGLIGKGSDGCEKDTNLAKSYLAIGAAAGDANCLNGLGNIYFNENNYEMALPYYLLAADKGSGSGAANAGYAYLTGKGTARNGKKALNIVY